MIYFENMRIEAFRLSDVLVDARAVGRALPTLVEL
jgi:hypothetical protein